MIKAWSTVTREALRVVEGSKHVGRKAIAGRNMTKGELFNEFKAPVLPEPTMHTVCLGKGVHVSPTYGAEFISHACGTQVPNTQILVKDRVGTFRALRNIEQGEDLYFNYTSTEWIMSSPFSCTCPQCLKDGVSRKIQGFSRLSESEQQELLQANLVSDYVVSLLEESKTRSESAVL